MSGPDEPGVLPAPAAPTAPAVPLLSRVVAALQNAGRVVRTDWETGTIEISPVGDGPEPIGVLLPHAGCVVFYLVCPDPVPDGSLAAMEETAHRLNTELYLSAWELDPDTGLLATRSGVALDLLAAAPVALAEQLVVAALTEAERAGATGLPAIAVAVGGASPIYAVDGSG